MYNVDKPEEWLEALYRANGPDADKAKELLDRLADLGDEVDTANKTEEQLDAVIDVISESHFASEFVTVDKGDWAEDLAKCFEYATAQDYQLFKIREALQSAEGVREKPKRADQLQEIRQLLVDAGVLDAKSKRDDLVGLLRMFIPTE